VLLCSKPQLLQRSANIAANDFHQHLVREERLMYQPPGVTTSANDCTRSA
jgi:hypothetical protein